MASPVHQRWIAPTICGVVVMVLVAAGCSNGPVETETTPPDDRPTPRATTGVLTGTAPRATGGFPSVVIFEPEVPTEYPIPQDAALMDQYNTDFHPRLLVVRVGQTVQFKNSEDTLHNVHVIDTVTRETAFNVATPVTGAYDYVFEHASVFDVSCGVHPSMAAIIVVTETPYTAVADPDGAFTMPAVPSGNYTVTVWNLDRSRRGELALTIDDATTVLELQDVSGDLP